MLFKKIKNITTMRLRKIKSTPLLKEVKMMKPLKVEEIFYDSKFQSNSECEIDGKHIELKEIKEVL